MRQTIAILALWSGLAAVALCAQAPNTASVAGRVSDGIGVIPHAIVAFESNAGTFKSETNDAGSYQLTGLTGGVYVLRVRVPGFRIYELKSIHLRENEQLRLPDVELEVLAGCGGSAARDSINLLPGHPTSGDLRGAVRRDVGALVGPLVSGATVTLVCGSDRVCGSTRTDTNGEFAFRGLDVEYYTVRASRAGFYPVEQRAFRVSPGVERLYFPVYLEPCPNGNCDPKLRPTKPVQICE